MEMMVVCWQIGRIYDLFITWQKQKLNWQELVFFSKFLIKFMYSVTCKQILIFDTL